MCEFSARWPRRFPFTTRSIRSATRRSAAWPSPRPWSKVLPCRESNLAKISVRRVVRWSRRVELDTRPTVVDLRPFGRFADLQRRHA